MKSLAEHLGLLPPSPEAATAAPDPESTVDAIFDGDLSPDEQADVRLFARKILSSLEYRRSLHRRILADALSPSVEQMLYHYGHGKPVERLEVADTTEPVTAASLPRLKERVLWLQRVIQQLEDDDPSPRIH